MLNEEQILRHGGVFSEFRKEIDDLYDDINWINHNFIGFATECDVIEYRDKRIIGYQVEIGPYVLKLKTDLAKLRRIWPKIDSEYNVNLLKKKLEGSRKGRIRVPGFPVYKRGGIGEVTELVGDLLGVLSNLNRRLKVIDRSYAELKSKEPSYYEPLEELEPYSEKIMGYAEKILVCVANDDIWLHYKEKWSEMNEYLKFFEKGHWKQSVNIFEEIDNIYDISEKPDQLYKDLSKNWANDIIILVNTYNSLRKSGRRMR